VYDDIMKELQYNGLTSFISHMVIFLLYVGLTDYFPSLAFVMLLLCALIDTIVFFHLFSVDIENYVISKRAFKK
jgi:hypothetical protein